VTSELTLAARGGDDDAFALLIQEHRASMRAVAIALLGYGDEAEDAVQDAVLIALRKLADLRDPAAAGPWLRAIVRNNCRMMLRARRAVPVAEPELLMPADSTLGPDEILDREVTRDWVRRAVGSLPEPVREVTVLRYFTGHTSYAQIAELCAVPADTVRSRLRDGRRALERSLRESSPAAHTDSRLSFAAARHEAEAAVEASRRGSFTGMIRDRFHPGATMTLAGALTATPAFLQNMLDFTGGAGVRMRLTEVAASRDLMVWETDFISPADDPEHCPPGLVWLHSMREGRTQRLRLAYRQASVA
jgi:RNA polymerase sigma factor (sigma-70 family)